MCVCVWGGGRGGSSVADSEWPWACDCLYEQEHEPTWTEFLYHQERASGCHHSYQNLHSYLYGQEILLWTDNMAVKWLRSLKAPTGQTFRLLQQLETYNMTTEHNAEKSHVRVDALSRKPCKVCQLQEALNTAEGLSEEHVCCTVAEPTYLQLSLQEVTRVTTRGNQTKAEQQLKMGQEILNGWKPSDIRHLSWITVI